MVSANIIQYPFIHYWVIDRLERHRFIRLFLQCLTPREGRKLLIVTWGPYKSGNKLQGEQFIAKILRTLRSKTFIFQLAFDGTIAHRQPLS